VANTCPDCGADVEYAEQTTQVLTGSCGECHHGFAIYSEVSNAGGERRVVFSKGGEDVESAQTFVAPPCPECGEALTLKGSAGSRIEAACSSCGSTAAFVLAGDESVQEPRGAPDRGRSFERSDASSGPPRGRPCRQCGAPLRFTTAEDGTLTGECSSCGNRFTLPRRREESGGGGYRRGGGMGRREGFRPRGEYRPRTGGGGRFPGAGRRFERRPRSNDGGDGESDFRRRRPRRD
jgi:DNA-directed RNA polymerase subunit M/transcription elongation factor TFIIS